VPIAVFYADTDAENVFDDASMRAVEEACRRCSLVDGLETLVEEIRRKATMLDIAP
jgi:hypothetical protein